MINHELRSQGVGASEVAAILGMDPRRDAFSIWARKLNLIPEPEFNIRMRKGKYFERGIVDWYADATGQKTQWSDTTRQNPVRSWQLATPDAYVLHPETDLWCGGVDAKLVSWDQREGWGDSGTTLVPDHYAIQCQWTCSALDQPWWDIGAALGDELRVYRIHRDEQIEKTLLDTIGTWWKRHIIGRTQPDIGATEAAARYLKAKFPRNIQPLLVATPEQAVLLAEYKRLREEWDVMETRYTTVENQLKEIIGEAEGILHGPWKVTYKRIKDSMGTDWHAVAQQLLEVPCPMNHNPVDGTVEAAPLEDCSVCGGIGRVLPPEGRKKLLALADQCQVVTKEGTRRIHCSFGKGK